MACFSFWYKIWTVGYECRIDKGNMPTRVSPDNHIEVCKITEGGSRVIIGWHVRNVFLHLFLYWWATVYILLSLSNEKRLLIISNQQLSLIMISKSLNKIIISKIIIKSFVFAKHIRENHWFDDEVT